MKIFIARPRLTDLFVQKLPCAGIGLQRAAVGVPQIGGVQRKQCVPGGHGVTGLGFHTFDLAGNLAQNWHVAVGGDAAGDGALGGDVAQLHSLDFHSGALDLFLGGVSGLAAARQCPQQQRRRQQRGKRFCFHSALLYF